MAKAKKSEPSFALLSPKPWHDPVTGDEALREAVQAIRRHVVLPDHADVAVALWCLHAHALDHFSISPRLAVLSPEKQCGKTTLLTVVSALVPRPLHCSNITAPAVFRTIPAHRPTLLIDEADTFLSDKEDLRGILNSGHNRQSAHVVRLVGDQHEPMLFDTWTPVVIAAIRGIPDTLMDRSVIVRMRRRLPGERVERLRHDRLHHLHEVARKLARFVEDQGPALDDQDPCLPEWLSDRAQDNWRPLLALADAAGGDWPELARAAALGLNRRYEEDEPTSGVLLLEDILDWLVETGASRVSSAKLVAYLVQREDRPWAEWKRGQPITPTGIAWLLKPFGIRPGKFRSGYDTLNGYERGPIEAAVRRYGGQGRSSPDASGTPEQASECNNLVQFRTGTDHGIDRHARTAKSLDSNGCSSVPGQQRWEVEL